MPNTVELRPDKALINLNFEKYQFASDVLPEISEIKLEKNVRRLEPSASQESWLEARLFAFHNHLFLNPYDMSCWFIDETWNVWRINKNGVFSKIHTMHDFDVKSPNGSYNPSFGFTTNITVLSNGKGGLELLLEDEFRATKSFQLEGAEAGVILDVQYVKNKSTIIVSMCIITDDAEKKCTKVFLLFYLWKDQSSDSQTFQFHHKQVLKVRGTVDYIYIEEDGDHLHSISQDSITFENRLPQIAKEKPEIKIPKYYWSQDEDSLTVWIKIPEEHNDEQPKVNVTSSRLSVSINNEILIQGECQHKLGENVATWKYDHGTLELELLKFESGLMWSELIKGDNGGEHLPNETLAAEIHSRLAHLCTDQLNDQTKEGQPCLGFNMEQLEECDLEGRDNILQRVNLITQDITHIGTLGTTNHVLYTYKTKSGQMICLRHDHDGCVWMVGSVDNNQWNIKHTYTFPGFGYVEASKSNKKFCVSPFDGSYVAIVEHTRHIFIYKRPEINSNISKQWIIDLGYEVSPIMGVVAINKYLIVLTKDKLYRIQTHM